MGLILFFIAYILFLPLSFINYFFVVNKQGYFRSYALNIDKFLNRELRAMWNSVLIKNNGYKFGNINESVSEVLGHNILKGKLTKSGKILVFLLTKKHCIDAIN